VKSRPPLPLTLVPVLLALVAWGAAVPGAGFAFDDLEAIRQNPLVNGTQPVWDAFRFDYWHHLGDAGHYRPLALLSLALDWRLFGEWAPGFHATSVLLHLLVVGFGALFARHIRPPQLAWAGLVGLALFAIHPALSDAVAWISGRTSTLSALPGVLFGWLLIRRESPGAAWTFTCVFAAAFLGLLAKEDGFFGAALPTLVALSRADAGELSARVSAALGLVVAAALYFSLRELALGQLLPHAPHAPLAGEPLGARLAAAGGAMAAGWRTLTWPVAIAPSWSGATWPSSPTSPAALAGWLPWLAQLGLALGLRRRARLPAVALALSALVWLPLQQWIPAGEIFAPRFLYLPLFFAALPIGAAALAVGKHLAAHRGGALALALTALLVPTCLVSLAWSGARPYGSLRAFAAATTDAFPSDARAWNTRGLGEEQAGDLAAALAAWRHAAELDPTYGRPHSNLARLALAAGRSQEAAREFEAAARLGSGNPIAWCNLGSFRLSERRAQASLDAYRRATSLAPGLLAAWRGRSRAALAAGQLDEARTALQAARTLAPEAAGLSELDEALGGP
jgi:tetratricopeptide (TPR) repeat protein